MDDEKIYYGCSVKMAYIPKFFLRMQSKIHVKKKFKKLRFWKLVCKTTKTVSIFILIFMTDKGGRGWGFFK